MKKVCMLFVFMLSLIHSEQVFAQDKSEDLFESEQKYTTVEVVFDHFHADTSGLIVIGPHIMVLKDYEMYLSGIIDLYVWHAINAAEMKWFLDNVDVVDRPKVNGFNYMQEYMNEAVRAVNLESYLRSFGCRIQQYVIIREPTEHDYKAIDAYHTNSSAMPVKRFE